MGTFSPRLQEANYKTQSAGWNYFWVVITDLKANLWSTVQP